MSEYTNRWVDKAKSRSMLLERNLLIEDGPGWLGCPQTSVRICNTYIDAGTEALPHCP